MFHCFTRFRAIPFRWSIKYDWQGWHDWLVLIVLAGSWLGWAAEVKAEVVRGSKRPTEGGAFAYSEDDQLVFFDEATGRVRVHYAIGGPSMTLLDDLNGDLLPDFVELVGNVAVNALSLYEKKGFRSPLPERDIGEENPGGSKALDIYLVDFQGGSDGVFVVDDCTESPLHCSGWVGIENDFAESSYPSRDEAVSTVVSHELFHAVQAAYHGAQPSWFSEGTAVWAQKLVYPNSVDFLQKCNAYLGLSGRPFYAPPTGPVPGFAYGTALFWWFLHERHAGALDPALQLATEKFSGSDVNLAHGIAETLASVGDSFADAWFEFVQLNLATGHRGGYLPGFDFATQLHGVESIISAEAINSELRLYPSAANYYHILHPGGRLAAGLDTPHDELRLKLFPVLKGEFDGPITEAIIEWDAAVTGVVDLGEREAGGYWIVATLPMIGIEMHKSRFCAGAYTYVQNCLMGEPLDPSTPPQPEESSESDVAGTTDSDQQLDSIPTQSGCSLLGLPNELRTELASRQSSLLPFERDLAESRKPSPSTIPSTLMGLCISMALLSLRRKR